MLLLLIGLSYSNSLYSPFVLDDYPSFVDVPNVYLEDLSLDSLTRLADTRFGVKRLLPLLTFAVDHQVGKGSVVQYHLTNILIHLLAASALYFFLFSLTRTAVARRELRFMRPGYFALFVCMLWALNPVQTNAVTYLVQRMTALATLFYLAALGCYIRARLAAGVPARMAWFTAALSAAAMAFMSKENAFTLPAAVLLVEFLFLSPGSAREILRRVSWRHWLCLLVAALVVLPLFMPFWERLMAGYAVRHFSFFERLLTESRIIVFYLSLLLLPLPGRMNLNHDFPLSTSYLSPPATILSVLFLGVLLLKAFEVRHRYPLAAFGVFWFFLNILIESSVVPLELVFEHRLYLPSVGVFFTLIALSDAAADRFAVNRKREGRQILFLAVIILTALSSVGTTLRNHDWRDVLAFYRDSALKSPAKPRALADYAVALIRFEKYEQGIAAGEQAMALGRDGYESYIASANNILIALLKQDRVQEAIRRGEEYIADMPRGAKTWSLEQLLETLGYAYQKDGRFERAVALYYRSILLTADAHLGRRIFRLESVLKQANRDEQGRDVLGLSGREIAVPLEMAAYLADLRLYEQARAYLGRAFELEPDNARALELRNVLAELRGRNEKQALRSTLRYRPAYEQKPLFRLLMRYADFVMQRYAPLRPTVGIALDRAEELAPEEPFVQVYRGRRLLRGNKPAAARKVVERALLHHPDFPPLLHLAAEVYEELDLDDKVIIVLDHLLDIYPAYPNWQRLVQWREALSARQAIQG